MPDPTLWGASPVVTFQSPGNFWLPTPPARSPYLMWKVQPVGEFRVFFRTLAGGGTGPGLGFTVSADAGLQAKVSQTVGEHFGIELTAGSGLQQALSHPDAATPRGFARELANACGVKVTIGAGTQTQLDIQLSSDPHGCFLEFEAPNAGIVHDLPPVEHMVNGRRCGMLVQCAVSMKLRAGLTEAGWALVLQRAQQVAAALLRFAAAVGGSAAAVPLAIGAAAVAGSAAVMVGMELAIAEARGRAHLITLASEYANGFVRTLYARDGSRHALADIDAAATPTNPADPARVRARAHGVRAACREVVAQGGAAKGVEAARKAFCARFDIRPRGIRPKEAWTGDNRQIQPLIDRLRSGMIARA